MISRPSALWIKSVNVRLPHDRLAGVITGNDERRTVERGPIVNSARKAHSSLRYRCRIDVSAGELSSHGTPIAKGRRHLARTPVERSKHRQIIDVLSSRETHDTWDHSPRSPGDTKAGNNTRGQSRGEVVSFEFSWYDLDLAGTSRGSSNSTKGAKREHTHFQENQCPANNHVLDERSMGRKGGWAHLMKGATAILETNMVYGSTHCRRDIQDLPFQHPHCYNSDHLFS